MNPEPVGNLLEQAARLSNLYSLGVVLAIIITLAFLYLIWAVMNTNNARETRLVNLIDGSIKEMHTMLIQQQNHSSEVSEKLRETETRNQQEHQSMIALLQRLLERK